VVGKLRALRPKVGILQPGRPGKALACVQEYLARRFEVRVFHNDGTEELARMLHGCDIAWFEDCSPALVIASKSAKRWRIICRLRLEGAYSPWVEQVRWENVDVLIAPPNQAVLGYLRQRAPDLAARTRLALVPDGVDTARFAFSDRQRGWNLACIGPLDMRHNPMFLLQCFRRLLEAHGPYRLAFAGMFADDKVEHYLTNMVAHMGLSSVISFEGFQEDLPAWLADKHYVVSAEVAAIQPTSVLEAMACGLKPVVHHFPGAEDFLDRRHLFATPEEFCRQIAEESYAPAKYRDTVTGRFALKDQLGAISGILRELEKAPLPKAGPEPSSQTGAFVKE
jgi:glycosyltransferase involved in cell wall biosynthesis